MNKFYDKIVLVVALLALGAGLAVYFMQSASVQANTIPVADNPYQPIDVSMPAQEEAKWPEAESQEKDGPRWLFDLFTPPKIYINAAGEFVVEAPYRIVEEPVEPFGVELVEIRRDPYRIQLEGYIEDDLTDASKSLLLLYDEEAQRSVRARVGAEKPAHEFQVLDFSITRVKDTDSNVTVTARATILDQRTGQEVVLTHGERLFEEDLVVIIETVQTGETIELSEAGEKFAAGDQAYILREINLEESSVTVEKLGDEENEPVVEVLNAQSQAARSATSPEPQTPTTTPDSNSDDNAEAFDFF